MNAPLTPPQTPDYTLIPQRYRCAWQIECGEAIACTFGVFAFNLQTSHSASEWFMSASVQLAFLAAAERSKIPFAIAARTDPSAITRALAVAGLLAGTSISTASLWQAVDTAFAPRSAAIEEAKAKLDAARQADADANRDYQAADRAVQAAQKAVDDDSARLTGASADYAKVPQICDRHGRRCHGDKTLGVNIADAKTTQKNDKTALHDAKATLAGIDTKTPAQNLRAAELENRKAARDDLYHHMAEDFFGEKARRRNCPLGQARPHRRGKPVHGSGR